MRPKRETGFSIAIICALPIEADAVEALFDETYDRLGKYYPKQPGDANSYINGRIGEHNVVLCYMPGMGKGSAASVASSLLVSYTRIQLALVVGICGGAPYPSSNTQIFLGDVIISDAVVEYDFGRQYPGGFQRKTDVKDILGRPDRAIRTLLAALKARKTHIEFQDKMFQHLCIIQQSEARWQHPGSKDILFEASYHHKHYSQDSSVQCCCFSGSSSDDICEDALKTNCSSLGCDENRVWRRRDSTEASKASVHIGKMASADTVMKSGEHRDEITGKEGVIGFETEGAGVWDNVSCIVVKGVCDYADSHKNTTWQAYAAATGASAAKTFLEYWRPIHEEEREHHWMVPFRRNPQFVGRQHEINQVENFISILDGPRELAITGLGGVGKTQVGLELAYRIRDRDSECSVFWIPCTSLESVEQAYLSIAQALGIQDMKPTEAKEQVKNNLSQASAGKWLLIFDNADDREMWTPDSNATTALKNFLPQSDQGHILFTTRNHQLAVDLAGLNVISIPELNEETGMKFLEKTLIQKGLLNDSGAAIALLTQLAFLPLAITQAVAYINRNRIEQLSDYIQLLEEQESEVVELLSEDFQDKWRYKDIQNPVATTWLISFQQIQHLNELAADYLSYTACVNPRDIPQSILPQPTSKKKRIEAIGLLKAYSFVSEQAGSNCISLHRLVHLATRNWMRKNHHFVQWIFKTADRLDGVFPDNDPANRQVWREYLPHTLSLIGESEFHIQRERYIGLLQKVGNCLYSDGRYNEAKALFSDMMALQLRKNGNEHPSTLTSMANLASTYQNQGQWKEAEELKVQVLEISKRVLGNEHPSTLTSMANLASTYWNQGRWKEAEELQVQVLEISKRVLGNEHPSTLTSMANLASTYQDQGRWKEAEELKVQVLEIRKRVLGNEHPDTLTSMANLASTYWNQGRWKEAEELEVQVMEIRKRVLGNEHPSTLTSMANLASTYQNQGRWKEVEELKVQVLEISKRVLGNEHPSTLTSMANLASTYWNQGRWKEAEELEVQVLEIRKRVLGNEHPDTLTSMANLAYTLKSLGRVEDALALMKMCVQLRSKKLGSEHPDTLSSSQALSKWQQLDNSSSNNLSVRIWRSLIGRAK
ncbi:hypothetical protein ACJ73_03029 [Blastomyces percursus]|uniref:Uncharacterized protein n=1 Tax=Blastomyces percursus TaxID=1658174 RepID=A0A1J9RC89_9EURO|nr:hypothetical protein ACJ73_03029 [Blastomyces percursus]